MKSKEINTHERQIATLGEEARRKGLPITANPYEEGQSDSNIWVEGWRAADSKMLRQIQQVKK
jgi:hypothetical protein